MATEQIIIEGETVRHVRTEVLNETSLASLAPHLTTRLPTTLPLLPQHPVRFVHFNPDSGTGLVIVETPPRRHTIQVRHHDDDDTDYSEDAERCDADGISRFNVMLPYQYFAYGFNVNLSDNALINFTINTSYLFWAKDPIRSPDSPVWVAPCPNVDERGSICWGSTNSDSSSLSARIDDLINNFFTTVFNEDLGHRTPFETSLTKWEEASDFGPLSYRDWTFWDNEPSLPVSEIPDQLDIHPTNVAQLSPSFIALPELPENFTVARARAWLDNLNDGARRRLNAALALTETEA